MTQEDKDLLIQDLCARLPYGVKVKVLPDDGGVFGGYVEEIEAINNVGVFNNDGNFEVIENVKPYLFPLSSMTEEQRKEYLHLLFKAKVNTKSIGSLFSWLNEHHFDHCGLIDKGLAIDATGLNVY